MAKAMGYYLEGQGSNLGKTLHMVNDVC